MTGKPALVLVVDDTESLREVFEIVVSDAGYSVATASNGKAALPLVKELRPDVILLDMMMPEMDGLTFLANLRETPDAPPVIAMSAFESFHADARASGATAFLHKPVDTNELLAVLDAVLTGAELKVRERAIDEIMARRAAASAARERLLSRLDMSAPEIANRLRALVTWCAGYFNVSMAFVNLQRRNKIHFQAAVSGDPHFAEGLDAEPGDSLCSMVVDADTSMVIGDTLVNAVFAKHPAVVAGCRFYAGVPLRTPDGLTLGTVCLLDGTPHTFFGEDLSVLETVADGIARRLSALATGQVSGAYTFCVPDVFAHEKFTAILVASVRRAVRNQQAIELAHVDLGTGDEAGYRRFAEVVQAGAGRACLGIGERSRGVMSLLVSAEDEAWARRRMDAALTEARNSIDIHGVGLVTFPSDGASTLDARTFEAMADQALSESVLGGGAIRHVSVQARASSPLTGSVGAQLH